MHYVVEDFRQNIFAGKYTQLSSTTRNLAQVKKKPSASLKSGFGFDISQHPGSSLR